MRGYNNVATKCNSNSFVCALLLLANYQLFPCYNPLNVLVVVGVQKQSTERHSNREPEAVEGKGSKKW